MIFLIEIWHMARRNHTGHRRLPDSRMARHDLDIARRVGFKLTPSPMLYQQNSLTRSFGIKTSISIIFEDIQPRWMWKTLFTHHSSLAQFQGNYVNWTVYVVMMATMVTCRSLKAKFEGLLPLVYIHLWGPHYVLDDVGVGASVGLGISVFLHSESSEHSTTLYLTGLKCDSAWWQYTGKLDGTNDVCRIFILLHKVECQLNLRFSIRKMQACILCHAMSLPCTECAKAQRQSSNSHLLLYHFKKCLSLSRNTVVQQIVSNA